MAFLSSVLLLSAGVVGTLASSYPAPDLSLSLQDILNKAHQGPLYTYPTSLTQGIVPVSREYILGVRDLEANKGLERNPFSQRLYIPSTLPMISID